MAQPNFNLDAQAFNRSTHGMIQPRNIPMLEVEEEAMIVNPQIFQPPREALQGERGHEVGAGAEDMLSLDLVMAQAHDLQTFRDFESYLFDRDNSQDAPLDYYTDSEE